MNHRKGKLLELCYEQVQMLQETFCWVLHFSPVEEGLVSGVELSVGLLNLAAHHPGRWKVQYRCYRELQLCMAEGLSSRHLFQIKISQCRKENRPQMWPLRVAELRNDCL